MKKEEKNNKEMNGDSPIELISADPEKEEYAPLLRVFISVSYMGILAAVMGIMASLLALVSGQNIGERMTLSVGALVVFTVLTVVLSFMDKKKGSEYDKSVKESDSQSVKFNGKVVGAEKHIKPIQYGNGSYQEITYNFVVEYKDENNDIVTVKSGRYLNDISKVLKNNTAVVMKRPDGTAVCRDFVLRDRDGDGVTFELKEIKED